MNYFEFTNPTKLCSGKGALDNLAYELEILGVAHPMILSDGMLAQIGTLKLVTDALDNMKI